MYFYQRLRDLREVAALLDITTRQYSLYEWGTREIPFHHAITLAKFCNVSLDYIAGLTNNKKADKKSPSREGDFFILPCYAR